MRPRIWEPPVEPSPAERAVIKAVRRAKLFVFLRGHRHELFDGQFQAELAGAYADSPKGQPPVPPALLALATILRACTRVSDDEVIEATVMDRRWQLVLDCTGAEEPPFSKGTLAGFRSRLIEHDLDRRLGLAQGVSVTGELDDVVHQQVRGAVALLDWLLYRQFRIGLERREEREVPLSCGRCPLKYRAYGVSIRATGQRAGEPGIRARAAARSGAVGGADRAEAPVIDRRDAGGTQPLGDRHDQGVRSAQREVRVLRAAEPPEQRGTCLSLIRTNGAGCGGCRTLVCAGTAGSRILGPVGVRRLEGR